MFLKKSTITVCFRNNFPTQRSVFFSTPPEKSFTPSEWLFEKGKTYDAALPYTTYLKFLNRMHIIVNMLIINVFRRLNERKV